MNENKLGSTISRLRKEKHITQRDLADALHISDKSVSRWECGSSQPTLEMMFQISRYFGISYKDLIEARLSDNNDDNEIVENIVKEFQEAGKKKVKTVTFWLIFSVILLIVLAIAFIFSNNFNRFKVYKVHSESQNIENILGTYVETNIRDILYLGDIKLKDKIPTNTDTICVNLYFIDNNKEIIIQNYSSLENIYLVDSQSYVKIDDLSKYFDNLYLRVTVTDKDNDVTIYEAKLRFGLSFTNNKIIYNDNLNTEDLNEIIKNLDFSNIESVLTQNGYERLEDTYLKINNEKYKILYNTDAYFIKIYYEENKFTYVYNYQLKSNLLEVSVTDENMTIIENYKYDVDDNNMECFTGKCNDYKKVLELYDDLVFSLLD